MVREKCKQMEPNERFRYFWLHSFRLLCRPRYIDPLGQATVMAGRDNCFRTCRPFVSLNFSKSSKTNQREHNVRYWRDCGVWPCGSFRSWPMYFITIAIMYKLICKRFFSLSFKNVVIAYICILE